MVTEAAQHIIAAGGKRFRPLLVVLGVAARAGGRPAEDVVEGRAVVVELTHVASLYHDDVMDEARLRRGSASANARWGNTVAILVGDSPVRPGVRHRLRPRAGVRPAPGADLRPAGPGPDRRDGRAAGRRGPAGALPAGGRRQDRLPDRHLGAVRCQDGRRRAAGAAGDGRLRRGDRRRLPAQRRHHRHHQRRDRQDPGHRPARGHPDPADPAGRAARPTRPMPGCSSCSTPTCATTPTWPRRWGCCAPTGASTRRGPRCSAGPTGPAPSCRPARRPRPGRPGRALRHGGHPGCVIVTRCSAARRLVLTSLGARRR